MSKSAKPRQQSETEAKAVANSIRTSPIKLNYVAAMIRGMKASEALNQLAFSNKRVAQHAFKCLQSAIANAENNHNLDVDSLIVAEAYVGKAMVMKRMNTRGRGRSARILKPFSNLTVIVREQKEAA